jgi:hypothetical protein
MKKTQKASLQGGTSQGLLRQCISLGSGKWTYHDKGFEVSVSGDGKELAQGKPFGVNN